MTTYPDLLKEWRKRRRMSQLDLAMEADVSARHISFLETGRAKPSRTMIVHLSEVLGVPLDARNVMMRSTGFAPAYAATPLTEAQMAPIRSAVDWTLDRHAPYPGIALDRLWRIVRLNGPARLLFGAVGLTEGQSMLEFLSNPVVPQVIENWPEVAHHISVRLRAESAAAGGIDELDEAITRLSAAAEPSDQPVGPAIPTVYRFGDQRLALFGTIAQFSTVVDETVDTLRIELFFPADEESEKFLKHLPV